MSKVMHEITICDRVYKIVYATNEEMNLIYDIRSGVANEKELLYGVCYNGYNEIYINGEITSEEYTKDQIYHEAMHAALEISLGDLCANLTLGEEDIVRIMTAIKHEQAKVYKQIYED